MAASQIRILACLGMAYLLFSASPVAWADNPKLNVLGWVENSELIFKTPTGETQRFTLKAKMDTGARTSSLHAKKITTFQKKGQNWVRFILDLGKKPLQLELPYELKKTVKSSEGNQEERPFIDLEICIAGEKLPVTVSLNDRSKMLYPLLLGRRFLEGKFLVDSGKTFLKGKPHCKKP